MQDRLLPLEAQAHFTNLFNQLVTLFDLLYYTYQKVLWYVSLLRVLGNAFRMENIVKVGIR